MNSFQAQCFLALAEQGSFSVAAEHVHISQPALSKQIASLEQELGVLLFERTHHSVQITPAGSYLADVFKKMSLEYEDSIRHAKQLSYGLPGVLHIGMLSGRGIPMIPDIIRGFRQENPEVTVSIELLSQSELIKNLSSGKSDIVIGFTQELDRMKNIETVTLRYFRNLLVYPANHRAGSIENPTLGDFRDDYFILPANDDRRLVERTWGFLCGKYGFTAKTKACATSVDSTILFVECGMGVAMLTEDAADAALKENRSIKTMDLDFVRSYVAAWKKANANPFIPDFVELLKRETNP